MKVKGQSCPNIDTYYGNITLRTKYGSSYLSKESSYL